ncbi:hypothetical protein [Alicyclobacillus cellulosilyticus]|nr:hypothetical protein [Alicyclobacillus cellulosilyticus]
MKWWKLAWTAAVMAGLTAGCANANRAASDVQNAAGHTARAAGDVVRGAADAAGDVTRAAGNAMQRAGNALENAARPAGDVAQRAVGTVLGAWSWAAGPVSSVSVRTHPATQTVFVHMVANTNAAGTTVHQVTPGGALTPQIGRRNIVLPQGWTLHATLTGNRAAGHSLMVVPNTPAVRAGRLPAYVVGRGAVGDVQRFTWHARTPGQYAIVCTTPHHRGEVLVTFTVSPTATRPAVTP